LFWGAFWEEGFFWGFFFLLGKREVPPLQIKKEREEVGRREISFRLNLGRFLSSGERSPSPLGNFFGWKR